MNPFEMVLGIVIVTAIASVLRAKYGVHRGDRHGVNNRFVDTGVQAENAALREEMRAMKERLAVLERLATDDNEAKRIDREIEKLRDRT